MSKNIHVFLLLIARQEVLPTFLYPGAQLHSNDPITFLHIWSQDPSTSHSLKSAMNNRKFEMKFILTQYPTFFIRRQ